MQTEISELKVNLIQWLTTLEDLDVLKKIASLRESEGHDWWNGVTESEKTSIEKGIQDANEGKVISHNEARKRYEKYL